MTNRRLIDDLRWARLAANPPLFGQRNQRRKGRRAMGIKYERKVQGALAEQFGEEYIPSPWFQYLSGDAPRMQWCQPDGLHVDLPGGRITIVEVKYQHTVDAWYQLYRYLAIVRHVFGEIWDYSLCEVVKWYDCAVAFPEPVQLLPRLDAAKPGAFHVHILKP